MTIADSGGPGASRFSDGDRVGVGHTKEPGEVIGVTPHTDGSCGYTVALDAGFQWTGPATVLHDITQPEPECPKCGWQRVVACMRAKCPGGGAWPALAGTFGLPTTKGDNG